MLDKTQCKSKQHICGSFPSLNNMCGSGGNSSFAIQELIIQHFFIFQKINTLKLSFTLELDKQPLRPSHIISVNHLDLDQAFATHEYQVQSKFLYQIKSIQYLGEFWTKNQALKRNYNRATIHHVHQKFIEEEVLYSQLCLFYFISTNNIKENYHTLFFILSPGMLKNKMK